MAIMISYALLKALKKYFICVVWKIHHRKRKTIMKSDKILNIQAFYQWHSASKVRKCFIFLSFLTWIPFLKMNTTNQSNSSVEFPALGSQFQASSFLFISVFSCVFPPYFQSNPLLVNSTTKGAMTLIFHLHLHLSKSFLVSLIPELRHFPWMY